jgi:hypothetical protein
MVAKIAYVRLTLPMDLTRCQLKPRAVLAAITCYVLVLEPIVSVQQGMKSIIVIKSKGVRAMKKILIILTISLILILVGILYGNGNQPVQEEMVTVEEAYTAYFPEQMPDLILDPMVGFPVY